MLEAMAFSVGVLVGAHMTPRAHGLCGTCDLEMYDLCHTCCIYHCARCPLLYYWTPKAGTCCRFVSRTESLSNMMHIA